MATPATRPRFETKPTKGAKTWLSDVRKAANLLGTPLMPWQTKGARLLTELRDDTLCDCHEPPRPLPRWKTVVVSVPRQQGKTALSRAAITAKAASEPNLQLFGTAQSRQYAAKHVVDLGEKLPGAVKGTPGRPRKNPVPIETARVLRGVGSERVDWPNGSRYAPISPTDGGGHGDSIDFMLVDEGWALQPHVMGGIRPAMIARPHSQLLIISTMGTVESEVWNQIVARGREAVEDPDSTLAYIEYSAGDDADVFDPAKWHRWMPALGRTVTTDDIKSAMADVDPSEAVRAFGNRTTVTMVTLFPTEWVEKAWRVIQPPERMVLAVDVNDSPMGAAISSGHIGEDGKAAVRLVEWRAGSPRWVPDQVAQMIKKRSIEAVSADFGGPAKQIQAELEAICQREYVPIVDRYPRLFGADCARLYDALREETVHLEKAGPLEESIQAAQKKAIGDLWVVSRRQMSADASPIIAAIIAHGLAVELSVTPRVESFIL